MAIAPRTASPTPRRDPAETDDPEARLRSAASAGDLSAFATLYGTYRDSVYHYLLRRCRGDRHLAEDLTQDTFIRALRGLGKYRDLGRPFGAWLMRIAGNLLTDHWKSGWNRLQIPWDDFTGDGEGWAVVPEEVAASPETQIVDQDGRRYLARALAGAVGRLTERQRQVVSLRYAEGLSVSDTALKLGLDQGAVKAATYRARQALQSDPAVHSLLAEVDWGPAETGPMSPRAVPAS